MLPGIKQVIGKIHRRGRHKMHHNNRCLSERMLADRRCLFPANTPVVKHAGQKIEMIVMGILTSLKGLCMAALKKPRLVCTYVLTKVRPGCKCLIERVSACSFHFFSKEGFR